MASLQEKKGRRLSFDFIHEKKNLNLMENLHGYDEDKDGWKFQLHAMFCMVSM